MLTYSNKTKYNIVITFKHRGKKMEEITEKYNVTAEILKEEILILLQDNYAAKINTAEEQRILSFSNGTSFKVEIIAL